MKILEFEQFSVYLENDYIVFRNNSSNVAIGYKNCFGDNILSIKRFLNTLFYEIFLYRNQYDKETWNINDRKLLDKCSNLFYEVQLGSIIENDFGGGHYYHKYTGEFDYLMFSYQGELNKENYNEISFEEYNKIFTRMAKKYGDIFVENNGLKLSDDFINNLIDQEKQLYSIKKID